MEKKKTYIVAPGCSFVGNGKTYKEGDEIEASFFGEKGAERLKSFMSGDKPKIVETTVPSDNEKKSGKSGKSATEGTKENKLSPREELEKIAVEKGVQEKDVSAMTDEELNIFLKESGALN